MAARQICFASAGPFFLCAHAVVSRELQEGARLHPGELLAGLSTVLLGLSLEVPSSSAVTSGA